MSSPRSARLPSGLLGLLAAGALLGSCRPSAPPHPRRVILITCDTLRRDRLGCYGYPRPTSPHLDAFAREGVVFDNAWTTAPKTTPAISALLTGRPPDEIGVTGGNLFLLSPAARTLAEAAQDAGLPTGAVVSNWVLRNQPEYGGAGIAQGFATFDDHMELRETNREIYERVAPDTTDAAIRWLEARKAHGEDEFLLWVHYQDPHGPYRPPESYLARVQRPLTDEPELELGTTPRGRGQIPSYQAFQGERRPESYRIRYEGEIAYFDEHLGRLLDWLRAADWYRDALIVFTADHGESLGEHGYWFCHGENLFPELVHVPLIVRFPDGTAHVRASDGRVACPAGHLDLWPTILEALRVPPGECPGLSLFRAELPEQRFLSQSLGRLARDRWTAFGDGRWRVVTEPGETVHLYDEARDAGDAVDVSVEQADVVRRLVALREEAHAAAQRERLEGRRIEADPETLKRLNALGYAEGDNN